MNEGCNCEKYEYNLLSWEWIISPLKPARIKAIVICKNCLKKRPIETGNEEMLQSKFPGIDIYAFKQKNNY